MEMTHPNEIVDTRLFAGKVLIVYLINPPEAFSGGIAIANPSVEERYGRTFLVGEVPESAGDWSSGLRIGIGFDQVAHFLEFTDVDEYVDKTSSMAGKIGRSFQ
jgi:uncharacterized protein (DUF1330 family)